MAYFVILNGNKIQQLFSTEYEVEIPNTAVPVETTEEQLREFSNIDARYYEDGKIKYDFNKEKLDENGKQIVIQRNSLLDKSDWTQVQDNALTQEQRNAWAVYRQELRDITNQSTFPESVIFPFKPRG